MTQKPTLLVLAAGMGSRYGGNKQIDTLAPVERPSWNILFFDATEQDSAKWYL
jgi:hypothetical protein